MAESRLGKGLGALFPSIVEEEQGNDHATQMRSRKEHDRHHNDSDKNKDRGAHQENDVLLHHNPISQTHQHQNESLLTHLSDHVSSAEQKDLKKRKVEGENPRETKRARSTSQHSTQRVRIPSWNDIERPSDIFFGSVGEEPRGERQKHYSPSALRHDDAQSLDQQTSQTTNVRQRSIFDETLPADNAVSPTQQAGHETVNGSREKNVSRETLHSEAQREAGNSRSSSVKGNRSAEDAEKSEQKVELVPVHGAYMADLRVDDIIPNKHQPRTVFDEDELKHLADSIRQVGVLQPIVVRRLEEPQEVQLQKGQSSDQQTSSEEDGKFRSGNTEEANQQHEAHYELIMGERRLRASKLAGLTRIPAIVKTTTDSEMLREALLENLQRVQLNPLEEAAAYQQMMEEFGLTQEKLSHAISQSRSQIANTLRLLKLPSEVQKLVASGVISAGHARALLGLTDQQSIVQLARRIVREGLSVRTVEETVALENGAEPKKKAVRSRQSYWTQSHLPAQLENHFDTKVSIRGSQKKGRIEITFSSPEELSRITALLMGKDKPHQPDTQDLDGWE